MAFNNPDSSDIAVQAEDTTIHAHKDILAAQSPYLEAMVQVSTKQRL